jgi:hypothetical protein
LSVEQFHLDDGGASRVCNSEKRDGPFANHEPRVQRSAARYVFKRTEMIVDI